MLNNKIFLACLGLAIITIIMGVLYKLNWEEWKDILQVISFSMILAMGYFFAHHQNQENSKLVLGTALALQTIIAIIIGWGTFYGKVFHNPIYIYERICDSTFLIYLLCLTIPPLIAIIMKIILNNGQPLYGGIISGHSAFTSTVFLLILNQNINMGVLLILPILAIILPRCISIDKTLEKILNRSSILASLVILYFSIQQKFTGILIV